MAPRNNPIRKRKQSKPASSSSGFSDEDVPVARSTADKVLTRAQRTPASKRKQSKPASASSPSASSEEDVRVAGSMADKVLTRSQKRGRPAVKPQPQSPPTNEDSAQSDEEFKFLPEDGEDSSSHKSSEEDEESDKEEEEEAERRGRRTRGKGSKRGKTGRRASKKPAAWKRDKFLEGEVHEGEMEQWEKDLERLDLDDSEALVKRPAASVEQREPSRDLLMPLLPFQKEWLAWGLSQESGPIKGGILADEMGMGKTIQAISLIVTARQASDLPAGDPGPGAAGQSTVASKKLPDGSTENRRLLISRNWSKQALSADAPIEASEKLPTKQTRVPRFPPNPAPVGGEVLTASREASAVLPAVKATLVICPVVAVFQWRLEIEKFTIPGSVKVLVYHGPKRALDLASLSQYDIVLSTYSVVESEYRRNLMPNKERCQWCGRSFLPARLRVHQTYFCGPHAKRTSAQAKTSKKKETLQRKLPGKRGKAKWGQESEDEGGQAVRGRRKEGQSSLADMDSDSAVEEEGQEYLKEANSESSKGHSVLHAVRWTRIVLDEAHSIKDRRCNTAKAVFALHSDFKWALSGTPLQNRVGELYSLIRFLQIDPYSYYFCRKCDCQSLEYSIEGTGKCGLCEHSPMSHFCWWNKFVANPIKKAGFQGVGRRAMLLLKHRVLNRVLIRRTKTERAADLTLPPRSATLRKDRFDPREEDFYQALYTQSQSQFNTYVESGTVVNNYAHIFDLLIRLRQAVDHPYLVVYSAANPMASDPVPAGDDTCGICHDPVEDGVLATCGHSFCRPCLEDYVSTGVEDAATSAGSRCPKCEKLLTVDLSLPAGKTGASVAPTAKWKRSILNRIDLSQFQSSTKIEALREEIVAMSEEDGSAKALVFSQFTSMLDLISFRLQKTGVKCVRLDGSMSMEARNRMIDEFTLDPDCKVFLMSLKAGGVALNLTVASHVFMMDPWWNPAVEQQAQDRIHRLGQYKPIKVTRFVIENTIEERILKLQEKKQLVFEGTVGGSSEAIGRLTEADLRFLFAN